MRELYRLVNQRHQEAGTGRPLTRLHVHTLAFQAIIVKHSSKWKNTMSATAKASLTAHRHVCGSPDIDLSKARLIMDESFSISRQEGSQRIPLQESRPVSCWDEDGYEVCVAPVLVCTEVYQTAGGGDNISAAGLVLQIWMRRLLSLFLYCIIIFFWGNASKQIMWSFELGESHKTCQQISTSYFTLKSQETNWRFCFYTFSLLNCKIYCIIEMRIMKMQCHGCITYMKMCLIVMKIMSMPSFYFFSLCKI